MLKKAFNLIIMICLFAGILSYASATGESGTLKVKVTDEKGFPLPGAFVYLSSDALIGFHTYITTDTGLVRFPALPPGNYKIMVEMPGFKTVNIEDIIIGVGQTVRFHITLEMSTVEEEITRKITSPTIDKESPKNSTNINKKILKHIPFQRNFTNVINSGPGIVSKNKNPQETSVHGSSVKSNTYVIDGFNLTDPASMTPMTNINYDILKEMELETTAHPAEVRHSGGGYINTVTQSGGNATNADIRLYYSGEKLTNTLWAPEEITGPYRSVPSVDKNSWDSSFSLSIPLLEDRGWLFGNARYINFSRMSAFTPWTDPQGKEQENYKQNHREILGFVKLGGVFTKQLRASASFTFSDRYKNVYEPVSSWNIAEEATRSWDHDKNYMAIGNLHYSLSQNSFLDLKAGFSSHTMPLKLNEDGLANPQYIDRGTGYHWGSARFNENSVRKRFHVGLYLTHFQDSLMWSHHEFKAGAEYEFIDLEWSAWKQDNLLVDYLYESPYYFGHETSPFSNNYVGKGRIHFYLASDIEDGLFTKDEIRRLGFFVQDSITFADRVSLNLSIRFDRSNTNLFEITKYESGNPLSVSIGEELIEPLSNINPYGNVLFPEWNNMIIWNSLSPRIGISFDVFGNGKTIFKASYSHYPEILSYRYSQSLNPFYPGRSHRFYWYDENLDGEVDEDDSFSLFHDDYRLYEKDSYSKRIDPDIKPPYLNELIFGIHQEIFKDFSLRINYIHKTKKNIIKNVLYSPDYDKYWYTTDKDTEGWWIPFNTTIPGIDDYPNTAATVYYLSKDAPLLFDQITNVPELTRKYKGLELILNKRMSHNWQFLGSFVYSQATGNVFLDYNATTGYSETALNPNYFVNRTKDSLLDLNKPISLKLLGTYKFPYNFYLSLNFTHLSGTPWARSVTVVPPESWANENNAIISGVNILLEEQGSNRYQSFNNLDVRIEKEFKIGGSSILRVYLDILNVLGTKHSYISENDGGHWYPDAENSSEGERILSTTYNKITSLLGTRVFKLCLHFNF